MENGNGVWSKKLRPHMDIAKESRTKLENDKKNKKVVIENEEVGLHVMIVRAVGVDCPSRYPFVQSRHYNVVFWIEPGEELRTSMSEGVSPLWNQKGMIYLQNLDDHPFLNVEVQRFNSIEDPGPSSGRVVVGRARIPFPKEFYRERLGTFPLVRTEGKIHRPEGYIILAMRLEKIMNSPCL